MVKLKNLVAPYPPEYGVFWTRTLNVAVFGKDEYPK
jgi:hypothetical protein